MAVGLVEKFPDHLYYGLPHATVAEYVELAHEMLRVRLEAMPAPVDRRVDALAQAAAAAEAALAEGNADAAQEASEVDIERWTDDLASMIQSGLGFWSLYTNSYVNERFSEEDKAKIDLEENREKAVRAEAAYAGMFGADGLGFFSLDYPERFHTLAAMLRALSSGELAELKELLHRPLSDRIEAFSAAYEVRVREHLETRDESRSLAKHRAALRYALALYVHSLRESADRWSKESCDHINTALQPLQDWSVRMKKRH